LAIKSESIIFKIGRLAKPSEAGRVRVGLAMNFGNIVREAHIALRRNAIRSILAYSASL
jgi:hypothetical protein